ncbi:unnamed protein product [Coccothraustes coccothraustes]
MKHVKVQVPAGGSHCCLLSVLDMFLELVTSEGFMIFTCKGEADNNRGVTKENFHKDKSSRTKEIKKFEGKQI